MERRRPSRRERSANHPLAEGQVPMSTTGAPANTSETPTSPSAGEARASFASWLSAKARHDRRDHPVGSRPRESVTPTRRSSSMRSRANGEPLSLVVRVEAALPAVFPHYDLALQCACMRACRRAQRRAGSRACAGSNRRRPSSGDRFTSWIASTARCRPIDSLTPFRVGSSTRRPSSKGRSSILRSTCWPRSTPSTGAKQVSACSIAPSTVRPGLEQQLGWWMSFAKWVCAGRPQPTLDGASSWLRDHVPVPSGPTALSWGDARHLQHHVPRLSSRGRARLGNGHARPCRDRSRVLSLLSEDSSRRGSASRICPAFRAATRRSPDTSGSAGRKLDDLLFYEVFAAWRNATVMLRIADLYEARGILSPGQRRRAEQRRQPHARRA